VIGTINTEEDEEDPEAKVEPSQAQSDNDHAGSAHEETLNRHQGSGPIPARSLPPQFLVLQLETGDSVFMLLHPNDLGQLHFVANTYRVPKPMITLQAGVHLAVDPTSRYMAVGSSEDMFAIYQLQDRAVLEKEFSEGTKLNHVAACTTRLIFDVILNLIFLYPSSGCEDSVMLLVLVSQRFKTRMIYHEWEAGQDISKIRSKSFTGHLLDYAHSVPLLLIPLKFKSAFVLICETSMCICRGMASNSPTFVPFDNDTTPALPSRYYNGNSRPLWTSWVRPARNTTFQKSYDNIFIVREDGKLMDLTFDKDLEVEHNEVGDFNASCGTAFACLDFKRADPENDDLFVNGGDGDLFVNGGDACSGGTYLVSISSIRVIPQLPKASFRSK
jgi:hypothetical protein